MFRPPLKTFAAASDWATGFETAAWHTSALQLQPLAPRVAKLLQLQPQNLLYGFETAAWHVSPTPDNRRCSFSPLRQGLQNCCSFSLKTSYRVSKLPLGTFRLPLKTLAAASDWAKGFETAAWHTSAPKPSLQLQPLAPSVAKRLRL
jgi:hypothetical protein